MKIRRIDWYPDEWLAGTAELSEFDRGVYITICCLIYSRGGRINEELLRRHCRAHGNALNASLARLCSAQKIVRNGPEIGQKRSENELETVQKRLGKLSESGTKGNEIKKMRAATRGGNGHATTTTTTTTNDSVEAHASTAAGSDPVRAMWDRGLKLLGPSSRALLGRSVKEHGPPAVMEAIIACETAGAVDPIAFFLGCLKERGNGRRRQDPHAAETAAFERVTRRGTAAADWGMDC